MASTTPVLIGGGASKQSVYEVSTTQLHELGTRGLLYDGREFEYVRSKHATAIGHDKLATYTPMIASDDKCAIQAAVAAGDKAIPITINPTIAFTENELAGCFISIDKHDTAGNGQLYRIASHAAKSTGSGTMTLYIDRPVVTAMTTNGTATLVTGASQVKISAGVAAQAQPVEVAAGVPLVDIPAGSTTAQYFWVQKKGLANVLFGTAVGAVGKSIIHGEDAGSFQVCSYDISAAADIDAFVSLGTIVSLLPIDTEYHVVNLSIA